MRGKPDLESGKNINMLQASEDWFRTTHYFHTYAIKVKNTFFLVSINIEANAKLLRISLPRTSFNSCASGMDFQMKNIDVFISSAV